MMKGEKGVRQWTTLPSILTKSSEGETHCFLNFVHRSISIMKVAQAKLKEIGPDDMNMEEYKVRSSLYICKPNMLISKATLTKNK